VKLFPKQREALTYATKRLNFLDGSVRSGKSHVTLIRFSEFVGKTDPSAKFCVGGVTNSSVDRNVVSPLQDMFGSHVNYVRSRNVFSLFGRDCVIFGSGTEGALRGSEFNGGYIDEVSLVGQSFFKMVLSRLSKEGAQCHGSTNPDNPNHWFKKEFIDRRNELDMYYNHFSIDDNIYLPRGYVESLKKEYTGIFYRRFILGEWVAGHGVIFDFFTDQYPYVIEVPPANADSYYISVDYGVQNPSVFLLMGCMNRPLPYNGLNLKAWCEDEYYYCGRDSMRQKTDSELADDFDKFVKGTGKKISGVVVDPSATSFIAELNKRGYVTIQACNTVLDGIRVHGKFLHQGAYAVCRKCQHTIDEYFGYAWDEKAVIRGEERPVKENDHTKDAERYFLYTIVNSGLSNYHLLAGE